MKLTKNFTLEEMCASDKARLYKIDNSVPEYRVPALRALCTEVLQPARDVLGMPIRVTSGYRCAALNNVVKGAATSQHLLGEAADLIPSDGTPQTLIRLFVILMDGVFDQLILERSGSKAWIHVSYRAGRNRQQVLLY